MEVRKFNSNRKVNGKGHKMIVSFLRREYSFLPGDPFIEEKKILEIK